MEFTWDPNKRRANLTKHGLDFADAELVFKGAVLAFEDKRFAYGERRYLAIGLLREIVVAIACTELREEHVRLISMRRATRNEQKIYFKRITD